MSNPSNCWYVSKELILCLRFVIYECRYILKAAQSIKKGHCIHGNHGKNQYGQKYPKQTLGNPKCKHINLHTELHRIYDLFIHSLSLHT